MLTFPPDISFVIQIASFLVLWFGLKRLLFDPVLRVLDEREARTSGVQQEAAAMIAATELSAADYERRLREVRLTLATEADAARHATEDAQRQVLSQARAQAGAELTRLRENLARQADAARTALAPEFQTIAALMVERVAGRTLA